MMGLREQAQADIAQITSNTNEFGIEMLLTAPSGETLTVAGLHTKHHLGVDTEGNRVQSKNASVSFSEKFLTDASYPCRNAKEEVELVGHKVEVKDSSGVTKKYIVQSIFPDETVGLIVLILGDYE